MGDAPHHSDEDAGGSENVAAATRQLQGSLQEIPRGVEGKDTEHGGGDQSADLLSLR